MNKACACVLLLMIFTFALHIPADAMENIDNPVLLTLIAYDSVYYRYDGGFLVRQAELFVKKHPEISIKWTLYPHPVYLNVIANMGKDEPLPDITLMETENAVYWKKAGQFFDHTSFIDNAFYDMDIQRFAGFGSIPYCIVSGVPEIKTVLFMNTQLAGFLGIPIPKNYDDIINLVRIAKAKSFRPLSFTRGSSKPWVNGLLPVILADISGETNWFSGLLNGSNAFDDQEFIDSLSELKKIIDDGIITKDSGDTKPVSTLEEYNEGRAVLLFEGIDITNFIDPGISADTILLPWPVAGNTERDSYYAGAMNSVGLSLTSQCIEDPLKLDAALKFIKFINRKEILLQRIANGNIAAAAVLGIDGKKKDIPAISQERYEYAKNATLCETPEYVLPKKIYQELGMKIMNLVYFETDLPGDIAKAMQEIWLEYLSQSN